MRKTVTVIIVEKTLFQKKIGVQEFGQKFVERLAHCALLRGLATAKMFFEKKIERTL